MIQEETLTKIIKALKKNGYKVERDGGATVDGCATGIMKISYKDNSHKYKLIHEIDLWKVENLEEVLIEKFNL